MRCAAISEVAIKLGYKTALVGEVEGIPWLEKIVTPNLFTYHLRENDKFAENDILIKIGRAHV